MPLNDLRDVLVECVRDLYSAETQLVKALPKMARAASHPELKAGFTAHLEETRGQVERLETVAELLGCKTRGKVCHAMKGLVEEGQEVIGEAGDPTAKDALLIAAAQKVEHYEIAGYGAARTFAQVLGEDKVADLLQQTLDEEKASDEKLTAVAESGLNQEAADGDGAETNGRSAKRKPAKARR